MEPQDIIVENSEYFCGDDEDDVQNKSTSENVQENHEGNDAAA